MTLCHPTQSIEIVNGCTFFGSFFHCYLYAILLGKIQEEYEGQKKEEEFDFGQFAIKQWNLFVKFYVFRLQKLWTTLFLLWKTFIPNCPELKSIYIFIEWKERGKTCEERRKDKNSNRKKYI